MSNKKILITGANGFLGAACSKALCERDDLELITVDIKGDVNYNGDLSKKSFVNRLPDCDVIINCAAVQYINKQPIFRKNWFYKNNVVVLENLFERFSASKMIHVSTSMVYDQSEEGPYNENSKIKSQGMYSESKVQAEAIVNRFLNSAVVVPCIIGGKGRGGLFVSFIKSIKSLGIVFLIGPSNLNTSLVHVDDVAQLIKIILEKNAVGKFNAAANDALTIEDWSNVVATKFGERIPLKIRFPLCIATILSKVSFWRFLAKEQVSMLRTSHVICCDRSKSIGWTPKYTSVMTIDSICEAYEK